MGYKIYLPTMNNKNITTHDIIISLLANEFPLSLKKIYYLGKRKYNHNVSYQAFFKATNQLVEKNILIKKNSEYEINLFWVKEIEEFAKKIKETYTYSNGKTLDEIKDVKSEGPVTEITFNSLGDLDNYFGILSNNYLSQLNIDEYICGEIKHTWWPILNSRGEYDATKNHDNYVKIRYICNGKTKIDEWVSDYYNNIGVENKIGIDCAQNYDLWIYGDNVIQTILPDELNKIIHRHFEESNTYGDFKVSLFLKEAFDAKFEVKVIINKNHFLAEH